MTINDYETEAAVITCDELTGDTPVSEAVEAAEENAQDVEALMEEHEAQQAFEKAEAEEATQEYSDAVKACEEGPLKDLAGCLRDAR